MKSFIIIIIIHHFQNINKQRTIMSILNKTIVNKFESSNIIVLWNLEIKLFFVICFASELLTCYPIKQKIKKQVYNCWKDIDSEFLNFLTDISSAKLVFFLISLAWRRTFSCCALLQANFFEKLVLPSVEKALDRNWFTYWIRRLSFDLQQKLEFVYNHLRVNILQKWPQGTILSNSSISTKLYKEKKQAWF